MSSHNHLTNINFQFVIDRLPMVSFHLQRAALPGINLSPVNLPSPNRTSRIYGDHAEYDELQIEFLVNEDMSNWYEIFSWLVGLSAPDHTDQMMDYTANNLYSDATLTVLSSSRNPNIEFTFTDLHPTNLGPTQFDSTSTDPTPILGTAAFAFTSMRFNRISS